MTEPTSATDAELDRRPFDELVAELQRIVGALESGSAGLEQSIALYREGLQLHAACERRLRDAQLAISELGRRGLAGAEPVAESDTDRASVAGADDDGESAGS
jgi:exodeoxyribonuclease VII small subunit